MKFTVSNLKPTLELLNRAVMTRSVIPAHTGILFEVYLDGSHPTLRLSSTNTEIFISALVENASDFEGVGAIVVPAKTLYEFFNLVGDAEVDAETNPKSQSIKLSSGNLKVNIKGYDAAEFLSPPENNFTGEFSVDNAAFIEAAKRAIICAADIDARPVLKTLPLVLENKSMSVVCGDGWRMASSNHIEVKHKGTPKDKDIAYLIPRNVGEIITKIGEKQDGDVRIQTSHGRVKLSWTTISIDTPLVEGNFPDLRKIIPTETLTSLHINRAALANSLTTANLFTSGDFKPVSFNPTDDGLIISSESQDAGGAEGIVPFELEGVASAEFYLSANFVADFLRVCKTEFVTIKLNSPKTAVVLQGKGDDSYVSVLMPVNVQKPEVVSAEGAQ